MESTPSLEKYANYRSGEVAIIGRPNAGKSTLLNALLGLKISIVSSKPQTTRDKIRGVYTDPRGQILLLDTPGIHRTKREQGLNAKMVRAAKEALSGPDGIWYLVDPKTELKHEEVVFELLQEVLKKNHKPWLYMVFTKKDWIDAKKLDISKLEADLTARLKELFPDLDVTRYEISALEKQNTEVLLAATYARLPLNPPFFTDEDQASDRPTRFFVEELIREQLFQKLRDELPYGCRVEIEHYKEEPKPIRIDARIWVERESQKRMVIGAGASLIKKIGIGARKEIEDFLGEKIFLGLNVKVDKDWTFKP